MTDDLVKRLRVAVTACRQSGLATAAAAISAAIAALEAKEAERDEVLENALKQIKSLLSYPNQSAVTQHVGRANVHFAWNVANEALKRPTAEPVKAERRTGPEDRRKSAGGDIDAGIERNDGFTRGPSRIRYGRRSGDRARWRGEPEPQAEPSLTESYSSDAGFAIDLDDHSNAGEPVRRCELAWLLRELDRRLAAMGGK